MKDSLLRNLLILGIYSGIFFLFLYCFSPLGLGASVSTGLILGFFAGLLNDIRQRLM